MDSLKEKRVSEVRMTLIERKKELQHILKFGIKEDVDRYFTVCEFWVMLESIDKSLRTVDEISQFRVMYLLADEYEGKHFKYGN